VFYRPNAGCASIKLFELDGQSVNQVVPIKKIRPARRIVDAPADADLIEIIAITLCKYALQI